MFPGANTVAAAPNAAPQGDGYLAATITVALNHGAAGIRRSEPVGVIALEDAAAIAIEVTGADIQIEVADIGIDA